MFTGIIDHVGTIQALKRVDESMLLSIASQFEDFTPGESIAVDGACLTVTEFSGNQFTAEVSKETLACTKAKDYEIGTRVNVERPVKVNQALGGHIVTGHIEKTILVKSIKLIDEFIEMTFSGCNRNDMSHIVSKGSVAINGVSLTINDVFDEGFSVMLIPHTLANTNLETLKAGSIVNIEVDYLAKVTVNFLKQQYIHNIGSHPECDAVILSAAKDLPATSRRSFAALRMTAKNAQDDSIGKIRDKVEANDERN